MVIWVIKFKNEGHKTSYIFDLKSLYSTVSFVFCEWVLGMAIQVVEFSNGGYKIRKVFA